MLACILVSICQIYYFTTGKIENGTYFPEDDSYFEGFLLVMILILHLNLVFQYLIAFELTRRYVIIIIENLKDSA